MNLNNNNRGVEKKYKRGKKARLGKDKKEGKLKERIEKVKETQIIKNK